MLDTDLLVKPYRRAIAVADVPKGIDRITRLERNAGDALSLRILVICTA